MNTNTKLATGLTIAALGATTGYVLVTPKAASDLPPLPTDIEAVASSEYTPPVPIEHGPTLMAVWNPSATEGCSYRLYHGTNLDKATWTVIAETTNTSAPFPSGAFGFLGVKAIRNGIESGWNTP